MTKTALIFGASGFIGGHLANKLMAQHNFNVICVDIIPPTDPLPNIKYIIADVRDLSKFDINETVDLIINLAAIHTTPGHETHEYYETNILGANEITAFARKKGIKDIIFTSSISVYGPKEEALSENSSLEPISAYGWSKYIAEKIHKTWQAEDKTRHLVISRPAVIFGKNEGGNFTRLAKLLHKGFFIYPGRKDTIKGCFYVKDLIEALLFAWNKQQPLIIFNASYPTRYTIEDIINTFKDTHFPKTKTFVLPRSLLSCAAYCLKPFSMFGLGIHPERITKLVKSTNITPKWLIEQNIDYKDGLKKAINDWHKETNGRFD